MGMKKEKRFKPKGYVNIFHKIIAENFPSFEKELPIHVQEASCQTNLTEIEPLLVILSLKQLAVRGKKQIMYKDKPIKITTDFSTEILKARRAWSEVFQGLKENNFSPRILYPAKLSFKIDRGIKVVYYIQKLKKIMSTKPQLQKILQGILYTEDKNKQNHE
jgi:hypothetical protein